MDNFNPPFFFNWTKGMSDLYLSKDMADVTFIVGTLGGEKTELNAHAMVLAMRSPVFKTMFYGELQKADINSRRVTIADIDAPTFKNLLKFMYTNKWNSLGSAEEALQLYIAADKYLLRHLKDLCRSFISTTTKPGEALAILQYAVSVDDNDLRESIRSVIEKNPDAVLANKDFLELTLPAATCLFSHFDLKSDEKNIFCYILEWCRSQLKTEVKGPEAQPQYLRDILVTSGLVTCVNLSKISAKEYINAFEAYGLLNEDSGVQLLRDILQTAEATDATVPRLKPSFPTLVLLDITPPTIPKTKPTNIVQLRPRGSSTAELGAITRSLAQPRRSM